MSPSRLRNPRLAVGSAAAIAIALSLFVPLLPYSVSLTIPDNYEPGVAACNKQSGNLFVVAVNDTQYQDCRANYAYPPVALAGRAAVPYALLGLGPAPYLHEFLVTQGNESALVYFRGASIEAAEHYYFPVTSLNPTGVVGIENASIALSPVGLPIISAVITNIGADPISGVMVRLQGPEPFGSNFTLNGVVWIGASLFACNDLAPMASCSASFPAYGNLAKGAKQVHFRVEAIGRTGRGYFVYQQSFTRDNPQSGVLDAAWVGDFIKAVNAQRNGSALQEDQTLDSFAQLRFDTALSNYSISDYGFATDVSRQFPAYDSLGETILYPGGYLANQYVAVVQQSAPGHWSVLVDPAFTRYGYFIGSGPVVVAKQPCSVTEYPGGGVNMTSFLASHGCAFDIIQGPWLVIELEG